MQQVEILNTKILQRRNSAIYKWKIRIASIKCVLRKIVPLNTQESEERGQIIMNLILLKIRTTTICTAWIQLNHF